MTLALEFFDILFLDLFPLCHLGFYPRDYPEVKHLVGPHQFGFNWSAHRQTGILCVAMAGILPWICTVL